jgi:hypothetical protein
MKRYTIIYSLFNTVLFRYAEGNSPTHAVELASLVGSGRTVHYIIEGWVDFVHSAFHTAANTQK